MTVNTRCHIGEQFFQALEGRRSEGSLRWVDYFREDFAKKEASFSIRSRLGNCPYRNKKKRLQFGIAPLFGAGSRLERDVRRFFCCTRRFSHAIVRCLAIRATLRRIVQKDNAVGSHVQARVRLTIFACVQVHAQIAALGQDFAAFLEVLNGVFGRFAEATDPVPGRDFLTVVLLVDRDRQIEVSANFSHCWVFS